jgi:NADH dehydrogenase
MNKSQRIETGSRVAVIGGGPAGSFFALYLLKYAAERGIRPEVTIYQEKDFSEVGPKGCKGCAGILSINLLKNLAELQLKVPSEIIQTKIEHYTVHSPHIAISIANPERGVEIASIYRGGGPCVSHDGGVGFDQWLLSQAQKQGAKIENQRVSQVYLEQGAEIQIVDKRLEYDLVVLATGVNSRPIPISGVDYMPPKTVTMALAELHVGLAEVQSRLGNTAHAFLIPQSGLIFGTLVPKGPFISVSLLSTGKRLVSINDFLNYDVVRSLLPGSYERVCGCQPRATTGYARNYCGDRFVAIGDAAVSRLYKDGIGSSLLTARRAAQTVVNHGLLRQNFRRYYQPFCQDISRDNRWGRLLFLANDKTKDSRTFLLAQRQLIAEEQNNVRGRQPFTRAAWGMFTGSYSYRAIGRMVFNPASLARFSLAFLKEAARNFSRGKGDYPRRLYVGGRKVLILGIGFGGTHTLRHLVRALNRNENVDITMVSNENFFLFTPLLHEVALGSIETRHIAYPIRRLHWRDRFNFVQADVKKISLAERKVVTTAGVFDFDYLVLALGSVTDMSELNSAGGNVYTLKTLLDAMLIRNHVIGIFEQASLEKNPERQRQLLTFVIAGGGYVSIQLITELRDFIFRDLTRFYKTINPDNIRIILVEAERKIVAQLHTKLGGYVMKHLKNMGIDVRLKSKVTRVWEDRVEINEKEIVPTRTVFWVTGVVAHPRIAEVEVEKDEIGRVVVNEYLEVPRIPGAYAVGDCAHFRDPSLGSAIPPRAHTTVRQAKIAAHNILAEIRGGDKKPYNYSQSGEIVSLGPSKAVMRLHGLRLYGFPARLIWLVAYSLLVAGAYNRIRILMDWLLSLMFGRDVTHLRLKE